MIDLGYAIDGWMDEQMDGQMIHMVEKWIDLR